MNAIVALVSQLASGTTAIPGTGGRPTRIRLGERFGDWTVKQYIAGTTVNGKVTRPVCVCLCKCGTVRNVVPHSLTSGRSKSCGHYTGGRPPGAGA